jgi:HK97 family phage portal protein
MGFISNLKRLFTKSAPLSAILYHNLGNSIITKNDALDFYQSWIYRCVNLRSTSIANIDFKLYRMNKKREVEEVMEHELLDLLYRVNPQTTKYDFLELTFTYLDIFGSGPWLLEGGKKGNKPTALQNLRPEYLTAIRDKQGKLLAYRYEIGTFKQEYDPQEVLILKNYNPRNPEKGLGIIEAVRQTAKNEDYILQHNNKLLENGARPSGTLEVEGTLDENTRKRLKKEFKDQYQSYENAYKVMLLEGGMKFNATAIPPKDLDFVASRGMNRDEIAGIFGVPKSLLGFTDANRASSYIAEYIFAKYTLEPLATKYIEQLNEFLVPRFGDDLWLGFEPLAQKDEQHELNVKDKAFNRWKTANEIREEEGFEPLNGGDIIYMPMSNMPYMSDAKPPVAKGFELVKMERTGNTAYVDHKTQKYIKKRILNRNVRLKNLVGKAVDDGFKKLEVKRKVIVRFVPEKKAFDLSDEQIDAFYKERMTEEPRIEGLWQKRFTEFFEAQKGRFLAAIDSKKSAIEDYNIPVEDELKATIDIINPLMWETFTKGTQSASNLIGEPSIMDMEFIKEWLGKVAEKSGTQINSTTIEAFEKTMNEGIAAGESIGELKNRVESLFEDFKGSRAELIARTETARGVTEAHRKMYEYYGFNDVKWLLSPGACPICVDEAAKEWNVKTIEGMIPRHCNCKCDHVPL